MSKLLTLLAVLLIVSGIVLLAVPRETAPAGPQGVAPGARAPAAVSTLTVVRNIAEQANAPLSILMGLVSLYYTRRTYINSKRLADNKPQS